MSNDVFAGMQRSEQALREQAKNSGKLTLRKSYDKTDKIQFGLLFVFALLSWILLYIPLIVLIVMMIKRRTTSENVYVVNIVTGEKFYITRTEWKEYKAGKKTDSQQVKSIKDMQ